MTVIVIIVIFLVLVIVSIIVLFPVIRIIIFSISEVIYAGKEKAASGAGPSESGNANK